MAIERKQIVKPYLLLCEGRDAEGFLISYLNSNELAADPRFSEEIQVLNFGGNDELNSFLNNLKNMDGFDRVTSLAVIRDAENDYTKACEEVCNSFRNCGFESSERCAEWVRAGTGLNTGFVLFPLDDEYGTLEDLCLQILSEENSQSILASIDGFLAEMESSQGRHYRRKHKNNLYTYFSSSEKFVTMPLGQASKAGAFDWGSDRLKPLRDFLRRGFTS